MGNDFKPDLGLVLSERYGKEIMHYFYSVKLHNIAHVGVELYSSMTETTVETVDYALSFDFHKEKLESLLTQITNSDFKEYLESVLLKEFIGAEEAEFYETPIEVDIKGKVGDLVESKYESFIPIIVEEFSKVKTF